MHGSVGSGSGATRALRTKSETQENRQADHPAAEAAGPGAEIARPLKLEAFLWTHRNECRPIVTTFFVPDSMNYSVMMYT